MAGCGVDPFNPKIGAMITMNNGSKNGDSVRGGRKALSLSGLTRRYRVILEESFAHERPENRGPEHRHFYEIIPCQGFKKPPEQKGPFISFFSEDPPTLMLYTNRVINAKSIWSEIKETPGTRADFHMDGEAVLHFPPELLEIVAEMAGAKKRRILTEEQKELLRLGREKAGLTRDEKGRLVHVQAQDLTHIETIPSPAGG